MMKVQSLSDEGSLKLQELRADLEIMRDFLARKTITLGEEERVGLLSEIARLSEKLDEVSEKCLTVGLLGGTGVGKSSFMNALAGATIAAASHRRPHTDRILIYRHRSTVIPFATLQPLPDWKEIVHEMDALRHILLCDMPDIDSLDGSHRQKVVDFLEHLDLLVWMVSPEKYADERFYGFLQEVPKASHNFYFIINKADLLFLTGSINEGYTGLTAVSGLFQNYLEAQGIHRPNLYTISTKEVLDGGGLSPWNQFSHFRTEIFRQRDAKEVTQIKAANLDMEIKQTIRLLHGELASLEKLRGILDRFIKDLENGRTDWKSRAKAFLKGVLKGTRGDRLLAMEQHLLPLVGFSRIIAYFLRDWQRITERLSALEPKTDCFAEGALIDLFQQELRILDDRLHQLVLKGGLRTVEGNYLRNYFDVPVLLDDFRRRMSETLRTVAGEWRMPSLWGFKIIQYAFYCILFSLVVISLSGEDSFEAFIVEPTWMRGGMLIIGALQRIFRPEGLAAIGSTLVILIFFGWWFYSLYKKILQRCEQKFIETVQTHMELLWEEELHKIIAAFQEAYQDMSERIAVLSVSDRYKYKRT